MKDKRLKCSIICGGIFFCLCLFVVIGLNSVLTEFIQSQLKMEPETYDMWGANPGATNTLTLRNFTFYNLTNPREYLYRNAVPVFREISNYLYQEWSNFTDYIYSEDMSLLEYNYWLYFTELNNSRDRNEKITILNVVPISFWSQLDNVPIETFALQGFGGLFVELNATIKIQALGQGVASQFISSESSFYFLCKGLSISSDQCEWLWNDAKYGFKNPNNYGVWVEFSYYNDFDSESFLYNYFRLSRLQMTGLKKQLIKWIKSVNNILNNWYCEGKECSNYELAISQLSSGGLTNNPPSGDPVESICFSGNVTCKGSPEISTYLHHQFKLVSNDSKYQQLTFSPITVSKLFTPQTGTFLNIGSLAKVFEAGFEYDRSSNLSVFEKLQTLLHAETLEHAFVLWNYLKYFTKEFVLKESAGGTRKMAALGGIFAQTLYSSFTAFGNWFVKDIVMILSAEIIGECESFIEKTIDNISDLKVRKLCANVSLSNYSSYEKLLAPCNHVEQQEIFRTKNNLTLFEMQDYCDENELSIFTILENVNNKISLQYKCKRSICTSYELSLKQFINSSVTLNPISNSLKEYYPSLTGKTWNAEMPEFEYRNYLLEYYDNLTIDPQVYNNETRLESLLSFDGFFSAPRMGDLLTISDDKEFEKQFYWENKTLLINYMRFISIEVGLGGYTVTKTVKELVFGYEDEFLKGIKETDPMLGGDPSIQTLVALNEPNCSLEEAKLYPQVMNTGYSSPAMTRQYKSLFDLDYIVFNKTYFDGTEVKSEFVNPFKEKAFINGTDAFQNPPGLSTEESLYIYVTNLYRVGILDYERDESRYGFELRRYKLSERFMASAKENPENDKFFQYESQFINMSFAGVPIFISRNHMFGANETWQRLIRIEDEKGNEQQSNKWDDTYLIIEPTTGASFTAVVFLQTNVLTPQDILYTNTPRMMPVFSLYRSANISEEATDKYFGDLKTALGAPRKLLLFTIIGMICCGFAALLLLHQRTVKQKAPIPSLIESEDDPVENDTK